MDPQEILNLVRRRPFEPFALRLHDGREFAVRHPEVILVTRRSIFIGWFNSDATDGPIDDWTIVSPIAIASIQPLAA